MGLSRRAETNEPSTLVATFVDVGSLFSLLSSRDHQVLYGRRGTGKTHALHYLGETVRKEGDIAVYVDMRTVGSSGGLYADTSVPVSERGTRLLVDTLAYVYNVLAGEVLEASYSNDHDFSVALRHLDHFGDSLTEVRVTGEEERESRTETENQTTRRGEAGLTVSKAPALSLRSSRESGDRQRVEVRTLSRGPLRHRVHFGAVANSIRGVVESIPGRLWILLDEWSDVPLDLQPLLADLMRRCLLPVREVTVKIGAIEQRSNFRESDGCGGYIGWTY